MYNLTLLVAGLSVMSFFARPAEPGKDAKDSRTGIYLNAGDYASSRLSYGGDCAGGDCVVRVHDLFGSATLSLACNGKKQVFHKDSIYGYRDCKKNDYRFAGRSAYQILDTAGFYLYSINRLVQGAKIARPQTQYYFSTVADGPVQELSLANLKQAFAGNTKFRYLLDAQFRSDKDLTAWDAILKTWKIKYLYRESLK